MRECSSKCPGLLKHGRSPYQTQTLMWFCMKTLGCHFIVFPTLRYKIACLYLPSSWALSGPWKSSAAFTWYPASANRTWSIKKFHRKPSWAPLQCTSWVHKTENLHRNEGEPIWVISSANIKHTQSPKTIKMEGNPKLSQQILDKAEIIREQNRHLPGMKPCPTHASSTWPVLTRVALADVSALLGLQTLSEKRDLMAWRQSSLSDWENLL